jgi:hypothetical protein
VGICRFNGVASMGSARIAAGREAGGSGGDGDGDGGAERWRESRRCCCCCCG